MQETIQINTSLKVNPIDDIEISMVDMSEGGKQVKNMTSRELFMWIVDCVNGTMLKAIEKSVGDHVNQLWDNNQLRFETEKILQQNVNECVKQFNSYAFKVKEDYEATHEKKEAALRTIWERVEHSKTLLSEFVNESQDALTENINHGYEWLKEQRKRMMENVGDETANQIVESTKNCMLELFTEIENRENNLTQRIEQLESSLENLQAFKKYAETKMK